MPRSKDQIQQPNDVAQKRNKRTERFHQILFDNGGGGNGGGDPGDNALNGNLPGHLRMYKKGRLKQPITPLNVRSRLHMILVLLYFQHGLYGSGNVDKVRANRRAARQSEGMRRYEAASVLHRHRERDRERQAQFEEEMKQQQEKNDRASAQAPYGKQQEDAHRREQEDLDRTYAQAMEAAWEKESRHEQAALGRQKDLERQARAGAIVEVVEDEIDYRPSREPAGDTLIELESDLLTLTKGPAPSTASLMEIAGRLEQELLDAAPFATSSDTLAADIGSIESDLPPWPGMTDMHANSPEWQPPGGNAASAGGASAWPFGAAAAYEQVPQHEYGLQAEPGLRGLLWSAIAKFGPVVPGLATLSWIWWPSSHSGGSDELKEIIRHQIWHEHLLSQLPPATEEEWGSIEIDEGTGDGGENETTTESAVTTSTARTRRRRGVAMAGQETAAAQEWGRVEAEANTIRRVTGGYVHLNALNQRLNIDSVPDVPWITVEIALISRWRRPDNRYVNFYYLLANGFTYKVLPFSFYENGLRKAQDIEFYKDNELKLTVHLRGDRGIIDKSVKALPVIAKNLAALKTQLEQEQAQNPEGATAKPIGNAVPRTGTGTIWRVTESTRESNKEMKNHDDIAIFEAIPASSSCSLDFPLLPENLMVDTRDADITALLKANYLASYSISTVGDVSRARITLTKEGAAPFDINLKGDTKTVRRILQINQLRSAQIENDSTITRQSQSMNQQLSEENVLAQEKSSDDDKLSFSTSPNIRSNIQPQPYSTPPTKTISLTLGNVNDNFTLPYGANGHWELVVPDLMDESGAEKRGSGKIDVENIHHVGGVQSGLRLADEGIDRHGKSFILLRSHTENFSLKIISGNGNSRFKILSKHVLSQIAAANQRSYEAYKSDTSLFSEEIFTPNPSVNGTYKIEDSAKPIKIISSHFEDGFLIDSFNHDAEISVDGAYQKSTRLATVSESLFLLELPSTNDKTKPYKTVFKNSANGKTLTIRAKNVLSNAVAMQLVTSLRFSAGGNENEFAKQMTRLSTVYATSAADEADNKSWAAGRWNKISRPSRERAVDFNNRRRNAAAHYWHPQYAFRPNAVPPFRVLRDALLIEHAGISPGEEGDMAWQGAPWDDMPVQPGKNDLSLHRSHFKPSATNAVVPKAWNWRALSFLDAATINPHDSAVEFAVENDIDKVKEYDAALKRTTRDFAQLASDVKPTYPIDAAAILVLLQWMNGEDIAGVDAVFPLYPRHKVDRSKAVFAVLSKAKASDLKTDHAARRTLIESLAYLLPDTIRYPRPAAVPSPATPAPATKAPATKEPPAQAPPPNVPETKQPATKAPATKAPAVNPAVVYIADDRSSDDGADAGVIAAALGIGSGFFVLLGITAGWLVTKATPAVLGAIGEFLGLLGEGATLLVVPTLEAAGGVGGGRHE
jgi:hypothetical protein